MQLANYSKAIGAGGTALVGGALAKITIKIINAKWPGFVDPDLVDAIDTLFVAGIAYLGAYIPPPPQPKGQ